MIELKNGLNVKHQGIELTDLSLSIEWYGKDLNFLYSNSAEWQKNGNIFESVNEKGDKFTLKILEEKGYVLVKPTITVNKDNGYSNVLRCIVGGFLACKPTSAVYNICEDVSNRRKALYGMGSEAVTTGLVKGQRVTGADFVAFKEEVGSGTIGVVSYDKYFTSVRFNQNGQFFVDAYPNEHWMTLDDVTYCAGDVIELDTFAVIKNNDDNALNFYGEIIKKQNGNREQFSPVSGWCSWYYYGPSVTEKAVLDNMNVAVKRNIPFDIIQIDDGWQIENGEWEANQKFPSGMKELAKKINDNGFTAGLWVAPFLFSNNCKAFTENPDWFIKLNDRYYIDYSVEKAQKWLYDLFYKISHEWGYRYIKVDLIDGAMATSGYSKKGFSGLTNVRTAYKIMRSAVTADTHILACTTHLGAIAGIADSVRCSMDIFEMWDSLKNVAIRQLKRLYISKYANVDPDCLMIRTHTAEDDECYRLCVRTEEEIKTFITYVSVSGGITMLSDKLSLLPESAFENLSALFPANKKPCKCLDFYEKELPEIFKYDTNGVTAYALINWQDVPQNYTLDSAGNSLAYKFWSKEIVNCAGEFNITLAPHASEIVYFANDEKAFISHKKSIMGIN